MCASYRGLVIVVRLKRVSCIHFEDKLPQKCHIKTDAVIYVNTIKGYKA